MVPQPKVSSFHKGRTVTFRRHADYALMVIALAGCSAFLACTSADHTSAPTLSPSDRAKLNERMDQMRSHYLLSDSVLCDSLYELITASVDLATNKHTVMKAFYYLRVSHRDVSRAMARFPGSNHPDLGPTLENWRDYWDAVDLFGRRSYDSAAVIYHDLIPRFVQDADTFGSLRVNYLLANIYGEFLFDQHAALPFLDAALPLAELQEQRFYIHAAKFQAHMKIGELDLAEKDLVNMDSLAMHMELLPPNEARNRGTRMRNHFDLLCARMLEDRTAALDTLHARYAELDHMLDKEYPNVQWNPLHNRVNYAKVLVDRGQYRSAKRVLLDIEKRMRGCVFCSGIEPDVYGLLSTVNERLLDLAAALHYAALRDSMQMPADAHKAELTKEHALSVARFKHQQDSVALAAQEERALVRLQAEKDRGQRTILLLIMGCSGVTVVLLWNRARLKRRLQLEQLRSRLSRDLHDDIGSTLSSINILSSVVQKRVEASGDAASANVLSKISERSQRLQRNMSDIVWSVDPDHDTLEELLTRMREFGASVLEPKGIMYRFDGQGDATTTLPPMVKSNLYLIFKEAVNNAAKHAQATEVVVSFTHENNRLRMTITDNGKGLETGDIAASSIGGNGLGNMRARAQEMNAELRITSSKPQGTAIDLVVPL